MPGRLPPKVSVVILNWNGKKFLRTCLQSLRQLRYPAVEVIVVDNNSSDGSVEFIQKEFPSVRLIKNRQNTGFAAGNNTGASIATGKYLLFINNDTKVTPDFLNPLVKEAEEDPTVGCIQPEMRVMHTPTLLDEAGAYLTFSGFLYHYGYRKPYRLPPYRRPREIFSAKGACMFLPRAVFDDVGAFDEDFFIFFEETDLCHRLWLAGYRVLYLPTSHIFHTVGGDTVDTYNYARRIYLTFKNMNVTYLKNFGTLHLATIYPMFLVFQIGLLFFFLVRDNSKAAQALMSAWWWNIVHLRRTMKKRVHVQHEVRHRSDSQLHRHIFQNPRMYYYYCLLFDAKRFADAFILSS